MKQLYIIESPLQLLNCYEAIKTFPAKNQNILIRLSGEEQNDNQIEKTIQLLKITEIAKISRVIINVKNRTIIDLIKSVYFKIFFLIIAHQLSKIFIGNYESRFIRFIIRFDKSKIILLDDGNLSLYVQDKFSVQKNYNWFSIFDLNLFENQKQIKNNYDFLNANLVHKQTKNPPLVLFIGSCLSECEIISEQKNIDLMRKISERYAGTKIIYVSHRREKATKLQSVSEIENIDVIKLDYPLELLPLTNEIRPTIIASFYSTALITLKQIYKVETEAFKFDYSAYSDVAEIDSVYSYYSMYIPIIEEKNINIR